MPPDIGRAKSNCVTMEPLDENVAENGFVDIDANSDAYGLLSLLENSNSDIIIVEDKKRK